ncbi:uncharacterized protein TNIN_287761 [Trichonephila inaurata madagascariensis]|uniref:Uncharacterized protein n=1 Tax=Trichonephila inaurata madagascariensis TaxID=2747483 RepID=A0A8X7CGU1_9ARAC|nr:uncharacterized protein TNIN_287761 [Trichonephila inaurata madagascariensis]
MPELEIDKKYPIAEIRQLTTKYGEKIVVELEDGSVISLPQRCVKRASDYLKLNVIMPLHFVYLGSKDTGKSCPAHMFKFENPLKFATKSTFIQQVLKENADINAAIPLVTEEEALQMEKKSFASD